jgi:hypothetical protein
MGLFTLSEFFDKITGLFIDFTLLTYFAYIGGRLSLRFAVMSIGAIIDAVPGLNVLPMTTLTFVIAFVIGRAVSKVLQSTPLRTAYTIGKKVFT